MYRKSVFIVLLALIVSCGQQNGTRTEKMEYVVDRAFKYDSIHKKIILGKIDDIQGKVLHDFGKIGHELVEGKDTAFVYKKILDGNRTRKFILTVIIKGGLANKNGVLDIENNENVIAFFSTDRPHPSEVKLFGYANEGKIEYKYINKEVIEVNIKIAGTVIDIITKDKILSKTKHIEIEGNFNKISSG
jgi:hypothetical protein